MEIISSLWLLLTHACLYLLYAKMKSKNTNCSKLYAYLPKYSTHVKYLPLSPVHIRSEFKFGIVIFVCSFPISKHLFLALDQICCVFVKDTWTFSATKQIKNTVYKLKYNALKIRWMLSEINKTDIVKWVWEFIFSTDAKNEICLMSVSSKCLTTYISVRLTSTLTHVNEIIMLTTCS